MLAALYPAADAQARVTASMIEHIEHDDALFAIIIRADFKEPGITFVTQPELSHQVAYISHGKGKCIEPHLHNPVLRSVQFTHEVLILRKGKLRVDLYGEDQAYVTSRMLHSGDTIVLMHGGHGFEVIEDLEMLEVKQGPYVGEQDKSRFPGITTAQAVVKE